MSIISLASSSMGTALTSASASLRDRIASFIAYRALKAAEAELQSLDNRMLKDIGLDRSEIGSILRDRAHERENGRRLGR